MSVSAACQEKENQERNKDSGKSKGRPKHHLTVRYCQRSCGMDLWNFSSVHTYILVLQYANLSYFPFSSPEPLLWFSNMLITQTSRYLSLLFQHLILHLLDLNDSQVYFFNSTAIVSNLIWLWHTVLHVWNPKGKSKVIILYVSCNTLIENTGNVLIHFFLLHGRPWIIAIVWGLCTEMSNHTMSWLIMNTERYCSAYLLCWCGHTHDVHKNT